MKINIDAPVLNQYGEKAPRKEGSKEHLLVRHCFIDALVLNDQAIDGTEKLVRYRLAQKVAKSGEVIELTLEEGVKMKELIGKSYGPQVYGQIYDMIEEATGGSKQE